jgi:hypothetical protein
MVVPVSTEGPRRCHMRIGLFEATITSQAAVVSDQADTYAVPGKGLAARNDAPGAGR